MHDSSLKYVVFYNVTEEEGLSQSHVGRRLWIRWIEKYYWENTEHVKVELCLWTENWRAFVDDIQPFCREILQELWLTQHVHKFWCLLSRMLSRPTFRWYKMQYEWSSTGKLERQIQLHSDSLPVILSRFDFGHFCCFFLPYPLVISVHQIMFGILHMTGLLPCFTWPHLCMGQISGQMVSSTFSPKMRFSGSSLK